MATEFQMPTIRVKKLRDDAVEPTKGSQEAAGLDLYTCESVTIPPGQAATLPTGIAMAIPEAMVGLIWPRSKLASKMGIDVLAGVVDSDYRGEIMISLLNTSLDPVELRVGDKVAQMVIQQHFSWLPMKLVHELDETERGFAGINSSEMRLQ